MPYGSVDDNFNKTDLKLATGANTGWVFLINIHQIIQGIDFCNYRFPSGFCGLSPITAECTCYNKEHSFPKAWFVEKIYIPCILICTLFGHQMLCKYKKTRLSYRVIRLLILLIMEIKLALPIRRQIMVIIILKYFEPIDSFKPDFAQVFYMLSPDMKILLSWVGRVVLLPVF